jgi:hypothetical protein
VVLLGDACAEEPLRRIADVVAPYEPFAASDDVRLAVDDDLPGASFLREWLISIPRLRKAKETGSEQSNIIVVI